MKLTGNYAEGLGFESAIVSLRGLEPVVNGARLNVSRTRTDSGAGGALIVRYHAPELGGGVFGVEIAPDSDGLALCWWLENLPGAFELDSLGLHFAVVDNLRAYFRNGYASWDGSYYVEPDAWRARYPEDAPPVGYAVTQLLPRYGSGSVIVGFDRHDRFQQTFGFDAHDDALTVLTLWDRKAREGLARCESERLLIFEHPGVEDALRVWAERVAGAAPVPPRYPARAITGWSSWYNLYASITEANILEHLHGAAEVVRREALPLQVFQIDDGFTPEMGDWLDVKPQFPRGMKPLLDDIRAAGFVPGLWIGPFMVGNRSRLYQEHPDWVVGDRLTGGPLALMKFYGEFRWHKRSEEYYILDTTHPDAFDYLRHVFHTWRHEWGCAYFKTDFMYFMSEYGPERAIWHTPGMTRIEIWRRTAEMIREAIGDATWVGCGCPLWASVGLVDAIRIGRDVGVFWSAPGDHSAQSMLRDQATRSFANHILWESDPDCILLRERFSHLTETEVRALAIYVGMAAGVVMTSDALHELSDERLALWRLVLNPERAVCRFPLAGESAAVYEPPDGDPVLVQVRASAGGDPVQAVFIFNTGEYPVRRHYMLAQLGLPAPGYVWDWDARQAWPGAAPHDAIALRLEPHAGRLLFVSPSPFDPADPPARLP